MALTLRLTDEEKAMLEEIEPDIGTASGTLKHMIAHWQVRENEIALFKRKLRDTENELARDQAKLDRLKDAWQVFASLAEGTERGNKKTVLSVEEQELKRIREGRAALEKAGQQKLWGDE